MESYQLIPSEFISQGTRCRGDLYLPQGIVQPPVVLMAHGFAAERSFRLPAYAAEFTRQGLAVFLFDYRCFGDSDGTPRHLVDPQRHIQDWQAAIAHVRTLPQVNGRSIALWGTSFSGGHVLIAAARDQQIKAVVAQAPFIDSISTMRKLGLRYLLQSTPHALRDIWRMITGQKPHMVKVVAPPDEFAVMNTPESYPGYTALIPDGSTWRNECPARILLTFALYRPQQQAARINCPVLLMIGEEDSLISETAVEKTSRRIPQAELVTYPFGHFDIYLGEPFADAVDRQASFLKQHLYAFAYSFA
ncbi:MAG: alpha/beta fold hydrolase [Anaerolineales bacterium]|nr:alpha/beta fold hydrolase [Anaerolineales bacterium]